MADGQQQPSYDEHGNVVSAALPSYDEKGNVVGASDTSMQGAVPRQQFLQGGSNLSPFEQRAVDQNAGSPLNLQGQGWAGKTQAALWGLQNTLNEHDLHRAMMGQLSQTDEASPFYKFGATAAGMGADVAGLVGSFTTPKNLTVGAALNVPYIKAIASGYMVKQGIDLFSQGPQPGEKEADFIQRVLLGGSMAAGGVAGTAESGVRAARDMSDFANRARSMKTIDEGFNSILQGPVRNALSNLSSLLRINVDNPAKTLAAEDYRDNLRKGVTVGGQVNAIPASIAMGSKAAVLRTGANAKIADIQGKLAAPNLTIQEAIDFRSDLGREAMKAKRAGDMRSYSIGMDGYNALSDIIGNRATAIGQSGVFDTYNTNARALFEHYAGPSGEVLNEMPNVGKNGIEKAMKILSDKDNTALWEETADRLDKLGGAGAADQLREMIKYSKTLATARQGMIKQYGQSLYRAAMNPNMTALAGFGVYLALHGAGMYGFAPYLAGTAVMSGLGPLKNSMDAGRVIKQMGTQELLGNVIPTQPPVQGTAPLPGGQLGQPGPAAPVGPTPAPTGGVPPNTQAPVTPGAGPERRVSPVGAQNSPAYDTLRDREYGEGGRKSPENIAKDKAERLTEAKQAKTTSRPPGAGKVDDAPNPTPDRRALVGRGAHGQVIVEFPNADYKDLFSLQGRTGARTRGETGRPSPNVEYIANRFGMSRQEVWEAAKAYKSRIMQAIKDKEEGTTYIAPKLGEKE
jgi:hypothetical protein